MMDVHDGSALMSVERPAIRKVSGRYMVGWRRVDVHGSAPMRIEAGSTTTAFFSLVDSGVRSAQVIDPHDDRVVQ